MSIHFGGRWATELDTIGSVNSSEKLNVMVSSAGGNLGGNYSHAVYSNGTLLYSGGANRSYRVSSYRCGSTGWTNISSAALDVYGSTTDAATLNTFLNNMLTGDLLVLTTYDEPNNNKSYFNTTLINNFGASKINNIAFRYCYILVSVKNKGVVCELLNSDVSYVSATLRLGK